MTLEDAQRLAYELESFIHQVRDGYVDETPSHRRALVRMFMEVLPDREAPR